MDEFIYKAPYEEECKRILEVNILPETYCSFNCIYCPIDRKEDRHQTDEIQDLGDVTKALDDLGRRMEEDRIEEVFLNGHGESLLHQALPRIIDFIHQKGAAVRLLSNGYLLHRPEYQAVANRCEAVIGELKNAADAGFQKSQRPLSGYTLEQYTANMKAFRAQYHGRFIFEVTIVKGYNDDEKSVAFLERVVKELHPDNLAVIPIDEPFQKVLGVGEDRLEAIRKRLEKARG